MATKTYTNNLIPTDANDLITVVKTETVNGDFAAALKVARKLSGGRKLQSAGVNDYVDGKHGRAWFGC
mgnify:FL=1